MSRHHWTLRRVLICVAVLLVALTLTCIGEV